MKKIFVIIAAVLLLCSCQKDKDITRKIPFGNLRIGPLSGEVTLLSAGKSDTTLGYGNFEPELIDYQAAPSPAITVAAFEELGRHKKGLYGAFTEISGRLRWGEEWRDKPIDLSNIVLTQHQIIDVCQNYRSWLWDFHNNIESENFFLTIDSLTGEYYVVNAEFRCYDNFGDIVFLFGKLKPERTASCCSGRIFVRDDNVDMLKLIAPMPKVSRVECDSFKPFTWSERRIFESINVFDGTIDYDSTEILFTEQLMSVGGVIDPYEIDVSSLLDNGGYRLNEVFSFFDLQPHLMSFYQSDIVGLCESNRDVFKTTAEYVMLVEEDDEDICGDPKYYAAIVSKNESGRLSIRLKKHDDFLNATKKELYLLLPCQSKKFSLLKTL